ncbi:MAG: hotdog domain-containing protein [Burkholderiales bacterium]
METIPTHWPPHAPVPAEAAPADFVTQLGHVEAHADGSLRLLTLAHHLNLNARVHGGVALGLHSEALHRTARRLAAESGRSLRARLGSLDLRFISAALEGAVLRAEVAVEMHRRSVAFLRCQLFAGDQLVSVAVATYLFDADAGDPSRTPQPTAQPPVDARLLTTVDASMKHMGPFFERSLPEGEYAAGFVAGPKNIDREHGTVHDGMVMYLADYACGRVALRRARRMCVTLNMQVRCYQPAMLGEWVEFAPRARHAAGDFVFVDTECVAGGRVVMSIGSVWKTVGPAIPR